MDKVNVFTEIDTFLNDFLSDMAENIQELLASDIGTIISVSVTLYIVVYGYMVLAGKIQTPLSDLMWNLGRFAIIIAFIKNEGGILTMFNEAVKDLSTIGGNGKSALGLFDSLLEAMSTFAEETAGGADMGTGWAVSVLIWFGFGLMAIPVSLTFLLSKITLYLLLALSPVFFFMLMWGWLKDSFSQFVTALLSNAMALICINVMIQSIITFVEEQMILDGNPFLVAFSFVAFGIIAGMAIKYMVSVVNTVMRVSAERAGAGILGVANAAKNAASALQAPFSPTQGSIARSQIAASNSQVATQKALQDLVNKIK